MFVFSDVSDKVLSVLDAEASPADSPQVIELATWFSLRGDMPRTAIHH